MGDFSKRKGARIVMGMGAGAALGLALGSLLLWLPLGIVFGAIWEKKR